MKNTIYFFLFYLCFCSNTVNAQVNVQDSLALVDLYNSTDGPNWFRNKNWKSGPVSTWDGIVVTNKRVTIIQMGGNNMKGNLPVSIGNLTHLIRMDLNGNQLEGKIPSSIGNLDSLIFLFLPYNNLSDSIPSSIGDLASLQYLDLGDNKLSGSIPFSIGNLKNLFELSIQSTSLSGRIPSSIGNLQNLQSLYLNNNQLSGSIPSSLGNLKKLQYLYLNQNQLSGEIPSSIGNIINLRELVLNNNKLGGRIPDIIGNLKSLGLIDLSNNLLKGEIPSSFGNLPLVILLLNNNRLSGEIPTLSKSGDQLKVNLSYNHFTFNGIEMIAQTFPNAIYNHQKNIPIHQNGNSLSVSAGGTLSNNTYKLLKWEAKGVYTVVATNQGDSVFHPAVNGIYQIKILNAVATGLVLYSKVIYYAAPANPLIASSENASQQFDKTNLFRVYPNPARNILYIETNGSAAFSLIDQSGKILATTNINGKGSIDVFQMTPGLYYLKNNSTGNVQKVVIAR